MLYNIPIETITMIPPTKRETYSTALDIVDVLVGSSMFVLMNGMKSDGNVDLQAIIPSTNTITTTSQSRIANFLINLWREDSCMGKSSSGDYVVGER